jgi:hypothetical protein
MKLFKILTTVILASLASAASAQSTAPLTFGDSDTDEDNWNYLMHFKLWGTEGISFGNKPTFSDTLGWVGTAAGDLESLGNGGSIGGPIIIGGSISGSSTKITTGPIRSDGTITAQAGNGIVKCSSTDLSNECSTDKVPEIRSNLKVPTLPENIPWPSGITVPSQKTSVINIDTMCPETDVCDIFYESISIENDGVLIVSMPDGGRPTRIFTKSLNMATHPKIAVRYTNKGNLESSDYEGNLLIYVDNNINFVNTDNSTIMGTFVSTGTIKLTCNIVFVGQMIANNLIIGNEIDGSHFRFMPFKGSDNSLSLLGNRANMFEENDTWQTIDLGLNNAAEENISFDYCFEFYSATGVQNTYAGYQDVGEADASHKFPICNKDESVKATIKAGDTKAEGIYIKPLVDGYVEKNESLWLQINNLEGAKLASNYEDGKGYKINIVSNDKLPTVSSELVVSVNEDSKHTFTSSEFKFQHASQKLASVIITSIPAKGSLTLNGTAVKANTNIAVANLSKFTYTPTANDFGNSYTTFKYKVVGDGTGDNTSAEYTATVNVIPVNDKPTAAETIFYVNELDHAVSGGPITVTDVSNERDKDTYAYSLVNESNSDYTAFNQLFEISKLSNQNATIKVKSGAKLDYSQKKEYSVYVNIKDNAATETQTVNGPQSSGLVKVTVKIVNENNPPTINNQTFSISEKSSDGSDWPSGKTVGTVLASDSDGDPLTFSIATTGVPFTFKNGTNWLIVSDGSTLNYEAMSSWTFKVVVSDDQGGSATANVTVNITDVNDAPTYEYKEYAFEIHESAPKGEFVGSVVAEDEDTWSKLTYTISDYMANSKDSEVFKIDAATGKIYLDAPIDYETKNTYKVFAKVADNGEDKGFENYSATALVTINLIDDPDSPVIVDDGKKSYDVAENTPTWTVIACYKVKDEDEKFLVNANIVVKNASNLKRSSFFGTGLTKKDSIYELCLIKSATALDYETMEHSHEIIISVTNESNLTTEISKTINILDVNEKPVISGNTEFSFYEHTGKNKIIGKLNSNDLDTAAIFTNNIFKIVSGDTSSFTITEDGKIFTKRDFNYEEDRHSFEIKIALSDKDLATYPDLITTENITITLKDMPEVPEITSKEFSVKENSKAGELIGIIEATDPDIDDTLKIFLDDESPYVTVSSNGEIRVREGANIDYEKMQKFTITVIAKDKDGLQSLPEEIVINVIDIDEPSSSSTIAKSSSSSKEIAAKSSSSRNDKASSSSYNNAKSSSSSAPSSSWSEAIESSNSSVTKSSSSSKGIATNSSSSRNDKASSSSYNDKKSSSSSKISDDEIPDFYVRMTGAFEFEIVMDESVPSIAKKYAVMDMKGQVLTVGELNDKNAYVKVPTRGAYIVKVGLGYRRINVR